MNDDLPTDGLDELPGDLPDRDDPTAALLRTVLHREADAVEPSPDGYTRIRAEIERSRPTRAARAGRRLAPLLAAAAAAASSGASRRPAPAAREGRLRSIPARIRA